MGRFGSVVAVLLSAGCGSGQAGPVPVRRALPAPAPRPAAACVATDYAPPLGCYFDSEDEVLGESLTLSDAATLAGRLRAYPPEANRPPCDPARAAQAVDFTRVRVFHAVVAAAGQRILGARASCGAEVTVTIDVGPECGGAERGPGYLLMLVPVGGPVRVVDVAPPQCPSYDGDPPP